MEKNETHLRGWRAFLRDCKQAAVLWRDPLARRVTKRKAPKPASKL
jgi:hypothetical protein